MNEPLRPETLDLQLDLTQAILARTSGSPCQRLQNLACAYVDGELEAGQNSLVQSHLEHCPACSALVAALASCQAVLPQLAEVDPGPWFTQRVLRATAQLPPPPPGFDWGRAWRQLMHRPRIALEAAYLGAAASLMGIYLPLPTPNLTARVPALVQPLSASAHRVLDQVAQAERRTSSALQEHLIPTETTPATPHPVSKVKALWQRLTTKARASWQAFRKTPSTAGRAEEKKPQPANP